MSYILIFSWLRMHQSCVQLRVDVTAQSGIHVPLAGCKK